MDPADLLRLADQFAALRPLLFKAEEDRNQAMHSVWMASGENEDATVRYKVTAKVKKGLHLHHQEMSVTDLQQFTYRIAESYGELAKFETNFLDEERE